MPLTIDSLRKLACEVARTPDVHVGIDNNEYGWHVIVHAGQPTVDEWQRVSFDTLRAPIMASASGMSLHEATSLAYVYLSERIYEQEVRDEADAERCMCQAGFGREACPVHSVDALQDRIEYDQRVALESHTEGDV